MITKICSHCGESFNAESNRRKFCSQKCFGLNQRVNLTDTEKKALKREYDKQYRAKNRDKLKKQKKEWFQQWYDPKRESVKRAQLKKEKPEQEQKRRKYMASKQYKNHKKRYDRIYRNNKKYGEFGECMILVLDIRDECLEQMPDWQIRYQQGVANKTLQRRRNYERLNSNKSERLPLGNLKRS